MRRPDKKLRGQRQAEDDEQKQADTADHHHGDRARVFFARIKLRQRAWTIEGPERM
jgi:hypothetical protein